MTECLLCGGEVPLQIAAASTELFECESNCVECPESLDVTDPMQKQILLQN